MRVAFLLLASSLAAGTFVAAQPHAGSAHDGQTTSGQKLATPAAPAS